jgi:lysozyme family protein
MDFETAFSRLLTFEGGFSNNPDDTGGATRYGVTEAVARKYGYTGDMTAFPLDLAKRIYHDEFWYPLRCDELPDALRYDIFDAAVNSGVGQAAKWFQTALGVPVDGVIGPRTLAAASVGIPSLVRVKFYGARLAFMTTLPGWTAFGKGWARRIADLLAA